MKFKNDTNENKKFRVDASGNYTGYRWITIRPGEIMELDKEVGERNELTIFKNKGKEKTEKVEKVIEDCQVDDKEIPKKKISKKKADILYKEKLEEIKGIGKKTAEDIIKIYNEEKDLIKAIGEDSDIPIRDDIAKILKKSLR